jgi:hypothetical protein
LYGNVPVRGADVIDRAIDCWKKPAAIRSAASVRLASGIPAWMSKIDGDRIIPLRAGSIHRRQDLEPLHLHDGAVVAVSRKAILLGEEYPEDPHAFFGVDRRAHHHRDWRNHRDRHQRDLYWAEAVLRSQTHAMRLAS